MDVDGVVTIVLLLAVVWNRSSLERVDPLYQKSSD
jgi:hypothetical protein